MISYIIGSCKITLTNAKVALILLSWFYGIDHDISYEDYKQMYIAAGGQQVAWIEKCFMEYPVKKVK